MFITSVPNVTPEATPRHHPASHFCSLCWSSRAAHFHGLSYPLVAQLPAHSSRRFLCRPCWIQGTCTRLSRAQTTINRSDSLDLIPVCSAPISSLRIPRHRRGGARASHVSHISLTTCHALGLRWLTIPDTPAFLPTTMHMHHGNRLLSGWSLRASGTLTPSPTTSTVITKLNCFRGLRFPLQPAVFSVYA